MSGITIGCMGSDQYRQLIPVFEEYGYSIIDLQNIFNSGLSFDEKERKFRNEMDKCDVLYNLYSGNSFWAKASYVKSIGKKVVTHWIGTDALDAIEGRVGYLGHSYLDHNFSCYDGIARELENIGIKTTVLPIIPFDMELSLAQNASEHSVLIYMPEERLDHYGYNESCELFRKFQNLKFHIVANANKNLFFKYPNVEVHGYLSHDQMDRLYDKVSVLIRWIKHDGLSMSVIEALIKGKRVIWNFPYDGVVYVRSVDEMINSLSEIISVPPTLDENVSRKTRERLSKEAFMKEFNCVMEKVLSVQNN